MAAVRFIANERAPLVADSPAHAAGGQYSFDVKLQAFEMSIDQPRTQHVSMAGHVETILRRASKMYDLTLIWPDTLNAQMEEFLFSIAAGEEFELDPYGSVGDSPGAWLALMQVGSGAIKLARMSHGSAPWRMVRMQARLVP